MKTVKLTSFAYSYKGTLYQPRDVLTVEDDVAEWLFSKRYATLVDEYEEPEIDIDEELDIDEYPTPD